MLASLICRNDYIGNGATAEYSYTFKIFVDADLQVLVQDTLGNQTLLTLLTDYTVSDAGEESGGSITLTAGKAWMTSGYLTNGYALTIRRNRSVLQETDVRNQGPFYQEAIEEAMDHMVMLIQALDEKYSRAFRLQESEVGTAAKTVIPSAVERAGKVLAFDSDGNPIASLPTGSVNLITLEVLTELPAVPAKPTLCVVESGGERILYFGNTVEWTALLSMK